MTDTHREKTEHLTPNDPTTRDYYPTASYEGDLENGDALHRTNTAQSSLTLTPEMFEKLYLSPKSDVTGSLRKTFGNPTPLALIGFLLSLTPLSCILMGWRGGGAPNIQVGSYYYLGGMCMVIGGFLEFILGNTFPFVVFVSFVRPPFLPKPIVRWSGRNFESWD